MAEVQNNYQVYFNRKSHTVSYKHKNRMAKRNQTYELCLCSSHVFVRDNRPHQSRTSRHRWDNEPESR